MTLPDFRQRIDDIDSPPQASHTPAEPSVFSVMGKKGGNVTKEKYRRNPGHWTAIGEKGGAAVKAKYGSDYYRAMANARWAKREKNNS